MCKQYRPDLGQRSFGGYLWGVSLLNVPLHVERVPFLGVSLDCVCIMSFARQWL